MNIPVTERHLHVKHGSLNVKLLSKYNFSQSVSSQSKARQRTVAYFVFLYLFFRSGQARLVRATTEGGSGIRIIHGMSSSDSEEDDDDDDDVDFAFHGGKVPSPPGRIDRKPECQLPP